MNCLKHSAIALLGAALSATAIAADTSAPSQTQIDDIIQKFAANESAFAKARGVYTYRQTARIQELEDGGAVRGRWETVSDIVFTPEGKRSEKVVRSPVSTLQNLIMTPEDLQDIQDVQPFVLTSEEIPKYFIRYLGKETVDEIDCYVFAVKPKKIEGKQRYFTGQVWVDDRDLQVVKTYGRAWGVANEKKKNFSPKFETFREQIDGKYWFPTYTIANDTLNFGNGPTIRMRETIRYEDYKRFGAESSITFGEEVKDVPPNPPGGGANTPATPAAPPVKPGTPPARK